MLENSLKLEPGFWSIETGNCVFKTLSQFTKVKSNVELSSDRISVHGKIH